MNLKESVSAFIDAKKDYYKQWMFEEPIVLSKSHNDELLRLQKIMYRLIHEFVTNYECYQHLMPLEPKAANVIKIFNQKEYQIGTYRTDFVYNDKNQVKLIEITCRFALNGVFSAALMNDIAQDFQQKNNLEMQFENFYEPMYSHLETYLKGKEGIVILKGDDVRNESKIYVSIFESMGYTVSEVNYKELENHLNSMKNSWVISELSFDEITSFSEDVLQQLMPLDIINDFRTVFLIHDKRFFSVLGNQQLLNTVLNSEEKSFFKQFYIPTYTEIEKIEMWNHAKENKDQWILKHRALGKSQKIYAGIVTDENEWLALFIETGKKDMILQEWIPQKKIKGYIGGIEYEDFVTGTLLFFDDNYFGMGDFRTSSFPVTNKVDHRKATSLIRASNEKMEYPKFLNYIH